MLLNENYNLGLLILFHLLLVAIVKLAMFYLVLKPSVEKQIQKLTEKLPQVNEQTLEDYGIYHNQAIIDNSYSVLNVIIKNNQQLSDLLRNVNEIYNNEISPKLQKYIKNQELHDYLVMNKMNTNFNIKIFIIFTAIIATIVFWYFTFSKYKTTRADLPELFLGNIIPLSIIFAFELFLLKKIVYNYKLSSKSGFLYKVLKKVYQK